MNDSVVNVLHMRDEIKFNFVKPGLFLSNSEDIQSIEVKENGKTFRFFPCMSKIFRVLEMIELRRKSR
jgi:hypothetical protein